MVFNSAANLWYFDSILRTLGWQKLNSATDYYPDGNIHQFCFSKTPNSTLFYIDIPASLEPNQFIDYISTHYPEHLL